MEQNDKKLTIAKALTNTLKAIAARPKAEHPEKWFALLAPLPNEKASDYRKRALRVIGERWGYKPASVRSMEEGYRAPNTAQFMKDLQTYGAVRFNRAGALIRASLGKGPSPDTYVMDLAAERTARRGVV